MQTELAEMLSLVQHRGACALDGFERLPDNLLQLKEVAISGDGEPTISPQFKDAIHTVLFVRAKEIVPFFKVVLITNGTGLNVPAVQRAIRLFTSKDEIWLKLDVGREQDSSTSTARTTFACIRAGRYRSIRNRNRSIPRPP